jgi:hypothetical protein
MRVVKHRLASRIDNVRAGLGLAIVLLGLLAGPAAQARAENRRCIVRLVEPTRDLKATRQQLRRTAGVPVDSIQSLSPIQVVVVLRCPSAARCDSAIARLSHATAWVSGVDVDAVRTVPSPVSASAAR